MDDGMGIEKNIRYTFIPKGVIIKWFKILIWVLLKQLNCLGNNTMPWNNVGGPKWKFLENVYS